MRLIDADALTQKMLAICNDCEKRKGMRNGKVKFIYQIGEAPCRACWVDDIKGEVEDAPTVDAVEVVRCKDCKWFVPDGDGWGTCVEDASKWEEDGFCSWGEWKGEEE